MDWRLPSTSLMPWNRRPSWPGRRTLFTGRGSLPWILDLELWAQAVRTILKEGGQLFVFEGHPLDALWDRDAAELTLRDDASYFSSDPQEQPGFPASVVKRSMGDCGPRLLERYWRPGHTLWFRKGLRFCIVGTTRCSSGNSFRNGQMR